MENIRAFLHKECQHIKKLHEKLHEKKYCMENIRAFLHKECQYIKGQRKQELRGS